MENSAPYDVRRFDSGATRSADAGRIDPEGFLSPLVIARFSQYMNTHRQQPDGTMRDSDNWQKGIPLETYAKGMWRHFLHFWTRHRGYPVDDPLAAPDLESDLCALLFNVQGYLFEVLESEYRVKQADRLLSAYGMARHPNFETSNAPR